MYKQKLSAGLILTVYIFIAASCSGERKQVVSPVQNQETSFMEVTIGGMMCTDCEEIIQKNVGKVEGIRSVKASYKTGEAVIEYSGDRADTAKIREAITGSGYLVKKFNPDIKKEGQK